MAPVKTQASSHRKGKSVAVDPSVEQEVEEEDVRSDSDHSEEEEARRDPNSECAPLIDPWYTLSPHFPKAPGDYVPPPVNRVWLALCR